VEEEYKVFGYRWVILAATIPMMICTEMYWLTLAPISSLAERYYGTSSFAISMFAASYMIMYILFALPASWVVDRFGYRVSLIAGALITAVFGLLRAAFAPHLAIVMVCQFIIAIGQPFILNISTKIPANWFPVAERATASGLLIMAQFLGIIVPMVLSPIIAQSHGIPVLYEIYAVIACVCAAAAILFTRERPAVTPGPEAEKEDLSLSLMGKLFKNRNFLYVLLIVFVANGVFNALMTLIESILKPRGFSPDQAGIVGALFVIAGVIGAVLVPLASDKVHRRIPFFVTSIALLVPLYLGITFISNYILVCIVAVFAGFTVLGVAPIVFQHGAEVAYPVKEGTSYGMMLLMGQISGILLVAIFEGLSSHTGLITIPMLFFVGMTMAAIPITLKMKESNILKELRNNVKNKSPLVI